MGLLRGTTTPPKENTEHRTQIAGVGVQKHTFLNISGALPLTLSTCEKTEVIMAEKEDNLLEELEEQEPSWAYESYDRSQRAKNYVLVAYPEDMPENWLDVMREDMFDMVISPLHDKDKNPTGEAKKAHYHILVSAGTSWITMNKLAEWGRTLKGIAKPQKCSNPKGMVRYFLHLDNPEKHLYNRSEIQVIGQYDIEPFFKATTGEERAIRREIMQFIVDNDIREFADLAEYCLIHNEVWDDYLAKSTYYIKEYVASRRYRARDGQLAMLEAQKELLRHEEAPERILVSMTKKDDKNVIDKPLEG